MKYLINIGSEIVMTSQKDAEILSFARNITETTGKSCNIYQLAYNVRSSESGIVVIDNIYSDYNNIVRRVLEINDISKSKLEQNKLNRKPTYVITRQWIIFIMHKIAGMSKTESGEHQKKDHATAIYAIKKIIDYYNYDKRFRMKYAEIINMCLLSNPKCFQYD